MGDQTPMNPLLIELEGIGPVHIAHSPRAKRLRITVRPGGVHVAVPRGMALVHGQAFAQAQSAWITRHVGQMRHLAETQAAFLHELPIIPDREARRKIAARLAELSAWHGLPYSRLSIRRQKTRWGSCSRHNAISLNLCLARLPAELMDYVILHELLHTRIKGHGRDFWQALDALVGESGRLRQRLRSYPLDQL